jgi:hypothetical protein
MPGSSARDPHPAAAAPPGTDSDLRALLVETDELLPVYRRGDAVYYREPHGVPALEDLAGIECVVTVDGGKRLLRTVYPSGNGLVALIAHAAPPMLNVRLEAAAPVLWVRKQLKATREPGAADSAGLGRGCRRGASRRQPEARGRTQTSRVLARGTRESLRNSADSPRRCG